MAQVPPHKYCRYCTVTYYIPYCSTVNTLILQYSICFTLPHLLLQTYCTYIAVLILHTRHATCAIYCSSFQAVCFTFLQPSGVEMCLENWEKLPPVMFAKAWYATGHVTKEQILELGQITESQWESCHLSPNPTGLNDILGPENAAEPSLADLIANGEMKRQRVIWMIGSKPREEDMVLLPGSLVFPIEKRMANYLFSLVQDGAEETKSKSTILFSKRSGKEASWQLLHKHTTADPNGCRSLKADVPPRTLKDVFFFAGPVYWQSQLYQYCIFLYCESHSCCLNAVDGASILQETSVNLLLPHL